MLCAELHVTLYLQTPTHYLAYVQREAAHVPASTPYSFGHPGRVYELTLRKAATCHWLPDTSQSMQELCCTAPSPASDLSAAAEPRAVTLCTCGHNLAAEGDLVAVPALQDQAHIALALVVLHCCIPSQ